MIGYNLKNIHWREVVWHRPYKLESVYEMLTHLAAMSPRGRLIWEARGCNGYVRYLLGAEHRYWSKIEEAMKSHGNIQFYDIRKHERPPVGEARRLKITHPLLSLNTNVNMSVVRAGLAAMAAVRKGQETVLQVVLGGSYAPTVFPAHLPDPHATWLDTVLGNVNPASAESRSNVKEKASQHSYQADIRIGVTGKDNTGRLAGIHGALKTLESAGVRVYTYLENPVTINQLRIPLRLPLRLSVKELTNFLLLPAGEDALEGAEGLHRNYCCRRTGTKNQLTAITTEPLP